MNALLLLIAGCVFAALAWAFWHFLGEYSFSALTLLAVLVLAADNIRLRRQLREKP